MVGFQVNGRAPSNSRRIALVTSGFDLGGGVPTIARWLRDCLRRTPGYTVDVHDLATSSRDKQSRRLLAPRSWMRRSLSEQYSEGGHVIKWGANAVELEVMRYWPRQELTQALQNYDLVQVVSGSPALALVAKGAGVPIVIWMASVVEWERQQQLAEQSGPFRLWRHAMTMLTTRVELDALREANAVLVLNASLLEYVSAAGYRRVATAIPGVDTAVFCPSDAGWRPDGHLLSICRLNDPRKGLERMIRAYAHIVDADNSSPGLVLAGWGELPVELVHLMRQLNLESRVTVCANVDPGSLPGLYRGASVFMQTSYEEGLGVSVLEAMACGIPVVSTESAGTKETVIDGVTGLLVSQEVGRDVASSVADKVLNVLRGEGAAMGAYARERCVSKFSTEVAITRFTDTYDDLLAGRSSVPWVRT